MAKIFTEKYCAVYEENQKIQKYVYGNVWVS